MKCTAPLVVNCENIKAVVCALGIGVFLEANVNRSQNSVAKFEKKRFWIIEFNLNDHIIVKLYHDARLLILITYQNETSTFRSASALLFLLQITSSRLEI